MKIDMHMR